MRKELIEAYDRMTMPEECSRKIERKLQLELEMKRRHKGKYTMVIAPTPQRSWWAAAAGLVCLVLTLSVGGTFLFLKASESAASRTPETVESVQMVPESTWKEETPAPKETDTETIPQEELNAAMVEFIGILGGNGTFYSQDYGKDMPISEYCETFGAASEVTMDVPKFTVVDMDGDGMNEVVLWLRVNGTSDYGTMVLRYQEGTVQGYTFASRQLSELKVDGTFQWSGSASYNGTGALTFTGTEYTINQPLYRESDKDNVTHYYQDGTEIPLEEYYLLDIQQMTKKDVLWHVYPMEQVHGLLESYECADRETESAAVSAYYYYDLFQSLAGGHIGRRDISSWDALCKYLTEEEYVWSIGEEGCLNVYFPDIPGSWFYAWQAGLNEIGEMGYYICTEDGEYEVMATGLNTECPQYFVDVDWMGEGTQVASLAEVSDYIAAATGISRELEQEQLAVTTCMEQFSSAYFTGDTRRMRELLADSFSGTVEAYGGSQDYVVNREIGSPEAVMQVGDTLTAVVEFKESAESDSYTYLTMELVKQEDDWKVQSYGLEK